MNEPKTVTNAALDKLPLFATDLEIAVAVVGKRNASRWKRDVIPMLERQGFPRWDPLHQGRPVPHVRQFYALYLGITAGFTMAPPDGEERAWIGKREEKKIDDEERRRAAGEDVPERHPITNEPTKLKAIAEYRAKTAAKYAETPYQQR
ncbi:hypothetical protein [Mesorhizobium sp. ESP-6-2]|uniref:hypothetical protein n=1 Tax=Mesorhizobium sp. ESP-6-2 TaxID=2876625 RepID=UPI001CCDFFA2|nr:hypothetical protein [Mesorhizobium sp. ESP-6-2]MBZ9808099.1 hypothetical protein [Mesorhizobium sp. ESP-6-2]